MSTANEFAIRIATPADSDGVDVLLQDSYPALLAAAYDRALLEPALKLMTRANPLLLACGTYYVAATTNGQIVGSGGWTRERPGTAVIEGQLGHLRHFATHSAWTKRGIGRAIYKRCERDARAAGIVQFECQASLNGEQFYAALGFARTRRLLVNLGHGVEFPSVLMHREL